MNEAVVYFLFQLGAWLIGGIPFGYLVAAGFGGIDIRKHGSGNIGATNVGRVLGFKFFVLVFLLDALKGALPVIAARFFTDSVSFEMAAPADGAGPAGVLRGDFLFLPELTGLAAIIGHLLPVWLGLKGGKGVATSLGALGFLFPVATMLGLIGFLLAFVGTGMVSVASIGFGAALTAAWFGLTADPFGSRQWFSTLMVLAVGVIILVRHRSNLVRVFQGTEPRVRMPWQAKPPAAALGASVGTQPAVEPAVAPVAPPTAPHAAGSAESTSATEGEAR